MGVWRKPEEHDDRWKAILAAMIVSLLLNYVIIATLVAHLLPEVPEPPEETEIVLVEDPAQDEPAPEPAPEEAAPPVPEPTPDRPKDLRPPEPLPRQKPPTPTPEPVAGVPMGPALPEPAPTDVTPTPAEPVEHPPAQLQTAMKWGSFERTFGQAMEQQREEFHQQSMEKRRGTLRMGSLTGKVKKAIYNNRSWVSQGEQVPLGQKAPIFRNYIKAAHDRIHQLFADSFLASLNSLDPKDPLNDFSLMTKMEFEILESGVVNEIRVIRTSGNTVFDAAAVDSLYRSSPYPPPPKSILSWNRRVYFRWGFYRNHRMCGIFNAEPYILREPGAAPEALPADQLNYIDG